MSDEVVLRHLSADCCGIWQTRHLEDGFGVSEKVALPLVVEVTAALIRDPRGRYLITQRRRGTHLEGLWEFPGGKRDAGETLEACLARELTEELGAEFTVEEKVDTVRWEYPDRAIVLHFFRCRLRAGVIQPQESQAMAWVEPERLREYDFPPADRELIERLSAMPESRADDGV